MSKQLFVIHQSPIGVIAPLSVAYGKVFIGADTVAVFSNDEQVARAIKEVKQQRFNDGKFHIVNRAKPHEFPIELKNCGSEISHSWGGKMYRAPIRRINGQSIESWVNQLRAKKQLSIA